MPSEVNEKKIEMVRQFNRFFTRKIGVLREGLLHSPYSLTEARIIFELGQSGQQTASWLGRELGLDSGYVSRTLAHLEQHGLLEKTRSDNDGRQFLLTLSSAGKDAFMLLNQRSREEVAEMLGELDADEQQQLFKAMQTIESLLTKNLKFSEPFILRPHEPGDMGWIVHRHAVLYAQEYGFDEQFEALVAQIVADFLSNYNPARERCWIAEMNGEIIGSVFVVQKDEQIARIRLLQVEPEARGLGLGTRLVEECIRFARHHGYQKMTLWTHDINVEARHIYTKTGFRQIEERTSHNFGQDLISETWELTL